MSNACKPWGLAIVAITLIACSATPDGAGRPVADGGAQPSAPPPVGLHPGAGNPPVASSSSGNQPLSLPKADAPPGQDDACPYCSPTGSNPFPCCAAGVCCSKASGVGSCCGAGGCLIANTICCGSATVADHACAVFSSKPFCSDGLCCDTACTGACQQCVPDSLGSTSGSCKPVPDGTSDPLCTPTCSGGVATTYTCKGGGCTAATQTPCGNYQCNGTACGTSCSSDAQCIASAYCTGGTCQPDKANGGACTAASQCQSGYCVDGVCCDSACSGTCQACSAALKGQGVNGTCGMIANGSDPQNECSDQGAASCGQDGACNGTGACRLYAATTTCASSTCTGNILTGSLCNGLGNCVASNGPCPGSLKCDTTSTCKTSCAADGDCVSGYYCQTSDGTCQPTQAVGTSCAKAAQCTSGNCVDGYCCDTACNGTCQACSAAKKGGGTNGTCGNIAANTDPDNECTKDPVSCTGHTGFCSGAGTCALYPDGTSCGSSTCSAGIQTGYACQGGACNPNSTTSCAPYLCANASSCASQCASDTDCVSGDFCRQSDHTCQAQCLSTQTCQCSNNSECATGHCVDGFCCDTACSGTCQACSAALKGSGKDGVCGSIQAGTDPDGECNDDGATSCGHDGSCDGAGACERYASGTACGTSCTGSTLTNLVCNGTGSCVGGTASPCAPFLCAANVCGTTCADDTACTAGGWCDTTSGVCQSDSSNGGACTRDAQCASGYCVDGVCCDTKCDGLCQACTAALKGAGSDGTCGSVANGKDPHNDCPDDGVTSCQRDGFCDGAGACRKYASGVSCGATTCVGNLVTGKVCNGTGTCINDTNGTSCGDYVCKNDACANPCATDADCISGDWCDAGTCKPKQANGQACSSVAACSSGNCVDGFCCDTACAGLCQACSAALKGSGSDGVCGPIAAGSDPESECADDGPTTCKNDGSCDGAGNCEKYAKGTVCGATECVGNLVTGQTCDGLGTCAVDTGGTDCAPYLCKGTQCANPCAADGDCVTGDFCDSGTCKPKGGAATPCSSATQCATGYCVDGYCCDQGCTGQCEACDVKGSEGACTPVTGAPVQPRPQCAGAGSACVGSCDGVNGAACVYPGSSVSCGTASCTDGVETDNACDGQGACKTGASTTKCNGFQCDTAGEHCLSTCSTDNDCATGYGCSTDHKCSPKGGSKCDGEHTITGADGTTTDCSPFKCESSGDCLKTCTTSDDCVAGFVCDATTKVCVKPTDSANSGDKGGCGCRTGRSGPSGAAFSLIALALAAGLARRRRKA